MHEGTSYVAKPRNASDSIAADLTDATDIISQKLSMLDSLLDDLNAARRSVNEPIASNHSSSYSATLPNRNIPVHTCANGHDSLNWFHSHDSDPEPLQGMYPPSGTNICSGCEFCEVIVRCMGNCYLF